MKKELSMIECDEIITGEAISLTVVMSVVAISLMAVIVYKLFSSKKGATTVPGGWKFSWN